MRRARQPCHTLHRPGGRSRVPCTKLGLDGNPRDTLLVRARLGIKCPRLVAHDRRFVIKAAVFDPLIWFFLCPFFTVPSLVPLSRFCHRYRSCQPPPQCSFHLRCPWHPPPPRPLLPAGVQTGCPSPETCPTLRSNTHQPRPCRPNCDGEDSHQIMILKPRSVPALRDWYPRKPALSAQLDGYHWIQRISFSSSGQK